MRVGIVFHKNPFAPPTGIDLVRLRAISSGLIKKGVQAEIIAPIGEPGTVADLIPVKPLSYLERPCRYDIVKTCYHDSVLLINGYTGPVVSRIVRVVDNRLPERDQPFRDKLLACQDIIKHRASILILNNEHNRERWTMLYGKEPPVALVPTGCPAEVPLPGKNPYDGNSEIMLFLGSLAAPRMVDMINAAARALRNICEIHLVGLNKICMYGGDPRCSLDPLIVNHGERSESEIWDYVRHANIGLALATGPHAFDNDMSKIVNYLRGGLPVLSEEPIVNNDLIAETGFGRIFTYGDVGDLASKASEILKLSLDANKDAVTRFVAREHSWDKRVDVYMDLFRTFV